MKITVDRAVIEQALEALNYVMRHGPAVQKAKDLLRTALGQPEQEPVAYVAGYFSGRVVVEPVNRALVMNTGTALYTTPPPQRKPLTDDEIKQIVREATAGSAIRRDGSTSHRIARAIEAAHGIKEKMK